MSASARSDKDVLTEILVSAGFEIKPDTHNSFELGECAICMETEDGSVSFYFKDGNLKNIYRRGW